MHADGEGAMTLSETIELVGQAVDAAGVALIVVGLLLTTSQFLMQARGDGSQAYRRFREGLGRTLLLGLEFLVAADVIRTVAVTPTFRSVGILAGIVAIRTFLSWTLELELNGQWPWRR
ncbi:MAG: DUF1622 domain-containing protein, partial [Caldilineaceae bacterium]|nr:DUF1622 domain-containing protein [Caldilineaceae bacterium]